MLRWSILRTYVRMRSRSFLLDKGDLYIYFELILLNLTLDSLDISFSFSTRNE